MKKNIFTIACAILFVFQANAQNSCPSFPKVSKFDTLTFIKTEMPTDAKNGKVSGNIYLGQGYMKRTGQSTLVPGFIPSNKPTWAIAIAHAWNYHRNIIKRVNYPQIGSLLATVIQETELGCVPGLTWDSTKHVSALMPLATNLMNNGGCFQLENNSGYAYLNQAYPTGRIPKTGYNSLVQSTTGFETSALLKTYYDINTSIIFNFYVGWKFFESIDYTKDKYAYIKSVSSAYNSGVFLFSSAANFFNHSQDNTQNWQGLPATVAGYPNTVAKWTSVLEGDVTYADYPTGSSLQGYYNKPISWTVVNDYLTIIQSMYTDVDFAIEVTPKVQAAFVKIAGNVSATIPFQKLGPVIDQIILSLPAEYPTPVSGIPSGVNLVCSGTVLPYGYVQLVQGGTQVNLGESVTMKIVVDNGQVDGLTYKWFKRTNVEAVETLIGTTQTITVSPSSLGEAIYTAQICSGSNCYQVNTLAPNGGVDTLNVMGIRLMVKKNSSCNATASTTVVNSTCKGMNNGSITVNVSGFNSGYQVYYSGSTSNGVVSGQVAGSGSSVVLSNVPDGTYNLRVVSNTASTCVAYASAKIDFVNDVVEILNSKLLSVTSCKANMEAVVSARPVPCKYVVQSFVPDFFTWDNNMFLGVQINSGATSVDSWNKLALKPTFSQFMDAQIVEKSYWVYSGDTINVSLMNNNSTQSFGYQVQIVNYVNAVEKTYTIPANSAKAGEGPYKVGSYVVTCPVPAIVSHTFNWSPAVNNQVNTSVTSTASGKATNTSDVVYTVTASKSNTQCVFSSSVKVAQDNLCVSTNSDEESEANHKTLKKVYNINGQELNIHAPNRGLLIYQFSDGSVEKVYMP